ncbi:MAG: nucleotidyltransferase [Methanosarcinales archaeon]
MITDDIHREALKKVVKQFRRRGIELLCIGSTAQLILTGKTRGMTKDIDVYPLEIERIQQNEFLKVLEEIAKILNGDFRVEQSGFTLIFTHKDNDIEVDIIFGFEKLQLTDDVVRYRKRIDDFQVPEFEFLIMMKLLGYLDNKGRIEIKEEEYLEDCRIISSFLKTNGISLNYEKMEVMVDWGHEKRGYPKEVLWEEIYGLFGENF